MSSLWVRASALAKWNSPDEYAASWDNWGAYDGDDHFTPYKHQHEDYDSSTDEVHGKHSLHPTFEAAGIRHAPCIMSRCPDHDFEHSDAFDEAESRMHEDQDRDREPKLHNLDLTKPVYGFEPTADLHTLRRYIKDPSSRPGHPSVFQHGGRQYVMNGHHGIAAALIRGDASIPVTHYNLDKD